MNMRRGWGFGIISSWNISESKAKDLEQEEGEGEKEKRVVIPPTGIKYY